MTNFYAMYLFLIIAIVLLVLGLIFKHSWLFWLSAIGWVTTGFYCISIATPAANFVGIFATFCFLTSIAVVIAPIVVNKKPEIIPPEKSDYYEVMANRYAKLRATAGHFKTKEYL